MEAFYAAFFRLPTVSPLAGKPNFDASKFHDEGQLL